MAVVTQRKRIDPDDPGGGESHGYHSAVEIDEDVGSWKDWVGPVLAILVVIGAIVALALTVNGSI